MTGFAAAPLNPKLGAEATPSWVPRQALQAVLIRICFGMEQMNASLCLRLLL